MNEWVPFSVRREKPEVRLFCFPFAGGNAARYISWSGRVSSKIEIHPVQHPGHGNRMGEELITSVEDMVNGLLDALGALLDALPFSFFGYSMGSIISFELARALRARNLPQPEALFLAATRAPDCKSEVSNVHKLSDIDLLKRVKAIDGIPDEFFDHPELVESMLPILRADFKICETYNFKQETPLRMPIFAFCGNDDKSALPSEVEPWQRQTEGEFDIRVYTGKHFFLNAYEGDVIQAVEHKLSLKGAAAAERISL